jgi:hypothetical protein
MPVSSPEFLSDYAPLSFHYARIVAMMEDHLQEKLECLAWVVDWL